MDKYIQNFLNELEKTPFLVSSLQVTSEEGHQWSLCKVKSSCEGPFGKHNCAAALPTMSSSCILFFTSSKAALSLHCSFSSFSQITPPPGSHEHSDLVTENIMLLFAWLWRQHVHCAASFLLATQTPVYGSSSNFVFPFDVSSFLSFFPFHSFFPSSEDSCVV